MRLSRYLLCGVIFAATLMGNVVNANAAPCPTDDEYKSAYFICSVLDKIGAECDMNYDFCGERKAEIFTGLFTDYPNSAEIKDWNGFGILGNGYQAAGLCLLRDLKWTPIVAVKPLDTPLGEAKITQEIGFLEFKSEILENPEPQQEFLGTLVGYHRATADVPVVGHVDLFTQRFEFSAIYKDLIGSGNTVGLFDVYLSDGLSLKAESMYQDFTATLRSIIVPTPYGTVSVKPQFDFLRRADLVKAPYINGNITSRLFNYHSVPARNQMKDLYGLNGLNDGLNYSTSYIPQKISTGWISQVALGGRDPDPSRSVWAWTPPGNTWDPDHFPLRPDLPDIYLDTARSASEKKPNGYFGASVEIAYEPLGMLPAVIRDNSFIKPIFRIFVRPKIEMGVTSQFDFWNAEISQWKGHNFNPKQFDNYRGLDIFSGVGIATDFALEAGLDFELTLELFIKKTLVNVHPRIGKPLFTKSAYNIGQRRAGAFTQLSLQQCPGCSAFSTYATLSGTTPDAEEHIKECLEKPTEPGEMPPSPTYEPGNPEDLLGLLEYPCNICIGWSDYTYYNSETGKYETIPEYVGTIFPAKVNDKPEDLQWECTLGKVGCYDMCSYDPNTKTLTVKTSAKEMNDLQYQLTYWEHCY